MHLISSAHGLILTFIFNHKILSTFFQIPLLIVLHFQNVACVLVLVLETFLSLNIIMCVCVCILIVSQVLIDLSNTAQLDNTPRWLPLKEQSESIEHSRAHHAAQGPPGSGSGQGHGQGHGQGYMSVPGLGPGHGMGQGQGQGEGSHDSPKNSVIKSRSHGIFPDPAKGKGI